MAESGLSIRAYGDADRDSVVALWQNVFAGDPPWNDPADVIERKKSVQAELFLVGVVEGLVVATVLAGFDGVRGWVHHLAVAPEYRRLGFAGQLMDYVEAELLALDCPKLNLQVRRSNAQVVAFYESRGFAIDDVISFGKPLGPWQRASRKRAPSSTKKRVES